MNMQENTVHVNQDNLRTLPLHTASVAENGQLYAKQRLELQRRGAYVRSTLTHGGQRIDPVLAFHLGLGEKK